jgi:predicted XRE-type DNA-binding protein
MPTVKKVNEPGHITTGNVLEDLGFSAQEIREMEIKYDLWVPIQAEIERRKLRQVLLAKILKVHQPDASLLLRGQISRFSITRLMQFAERLGLHVRLTVVASEQQTHTRKKTRIPMRKAATGSRKPVKASVTSRRRASA